MQHSYEPRMLAPTHPLSWPSAVVTLSVCQMIRQFIRPRIHLIWRLVSSHSYVAMIKIINPELVDRETNVWQPTVIYSCLVVRDTLQQRLKYIWKCKSLPGKEMKISHIQIPISLDEYLLVAALSLFKYTLSLLFLKLYLYLILPGNQNKTEVL